jgi:hypothetical protein
VADGLVEQDAGPARPEHDGHRARRGVHRAELEDSLARRLLRVLAPAFVLEIKIERDTPAAPPAPDLAPAVLLGDRGHVETREGPHVADGEARGRGDERHDLLARERRHDLCDARIGGARRGVHPPQQIELLREVRGHRRFRERIEVVRPAARGDSHHPRGARAVGDRPRLGRRLLQVLKRDVVRVGVAGSGSGKGPDPGPLAHVTGGFFDCPFLELQLFIHTVLEVDVGVVDAPEEVSPEDTLEKARGDVEAVGEEALGACASKLCHSSPAPSAGTEGSNPIAGPRLPQTFPRSRLYPASRAYRRT